MQNSIINQITGNPFQNGLSDLLDGPAMEVKVPGSGDFDLDSYSLRLPIMDGGLMDPVEVIESELDVGMDT